MTTCERTEYAWKMAHRLVATALLMKRQYQNAGMVVAREFCSDNGIDVYDIERKLRSEGKPFGRIDQNNPRMGQIDATENGAAWFWQGRKVTRT